MTRADPTADTQALTEPLSRKRLITIFIGLILGILMAALDQTIVATAMPTIAADLNGLQAISWIITTYLLAQTIAMPLYGRFGDVIGRKAAFQIAIVIFLVGSVAAGAAQSMGMLIAVRAVQGVGAGGLMIGAQTIMAEIVSARERGKYMSIMGPMIGVATVLGPLLGGYLTEYASWRWIFYINLPIGIAALVVVGAVLKLPKVQRKPRIDYLGAILMAGGVACLVLLLNWGGSRYDWLSPTILGLAAGVVVLLPLWLLVERKASEPILPLHLFRDGVFRINTPLAFMVGVAMFGAVSYLPTYLQLSLDASATKSGLLMLPLMGGLMFAAVVTGQTISRTGRYKAFPVIGTAVAALGMYLISTMDAASSRGESSMYMVVLGLGIGFVMPTLVLTVQNSVAERDIGSATANVNFFRQIGASFGVAVIGSLFTTRLADQLAQNLPAAAQGQAGQAAGAITPEKLDTLPPPIQHGIVVSYAHALVPLFLWLVPLLVIAFVLAWFLPEKKLATTLGTSSDADDETEVYADADTAAGSAGAEEEPVAEVTEHAADRTHAELQPTGNGHLADGQFAHAGSLSVLTSHLNGVDDDALATARQPMVTGAVYDSTQHPTRAVLTLLDTSGRQLHRVHTASDGSYHLNCPDRGVYMLVCTPTNGAATKPETRLLATDGRAVSRDFVLT